MTAATEEPTGVAAHRFGPGLGFALLSALSFGASGTLASGLLRADWSPALAVTLRITIGALALLPFTLRAAPAVAPAAGERLGDRPVRSIRRGLAQTCYFFAIERIPVGPALLIEYIAPIAVLLWQWAVHHQRPTRLIVLGTIVAFAGLLLVLGLTTDTPLDPIGVLWASIGMLGAAGFFILSARPDTGLPPMALAGGGLAVGSVVLWVMGLTGLLTFGAGQASAHYGVWDVPSWVALLALGLVTAALAYSAGIAATRRLGSRLASFVGLIEVVIAFGYAWLLLGQVPGGVQALGAVLLLGGVALVKLGEPDD